MENNTKKEGQKARVIYRLSEGMQRLLKRFSRGLSTRWKQGGGKSGEAEGPPSPYGSGVDW
jgi:hypothetical protein